jgi:hypothetical protein
VECRDNVPWKRTVWRLAGLQSPCFHTVSSTHYTGADERSPLSVRERRLLRNFHRGFVRDANVFREDAVFRSAQGVVPVVDCAVERSRIKGNDDSVSGVEPRNHFADLVDLAYYVGVGNKIVCNREGIFRGCDSDISVV